MIRIADAAMFADDRFRGAKCCGEILLRCSAAQLARP
jgi:hypothetical protein